MENLSLALKASAHEALLPRSQTENCGCLRPRWPLSASARQSIPRRDQLHPKTAQVTPRERLDCPKVRTQQTPPKLNAHHQALLLELLEEQNDATLAELRDRIYARTEVFVSVSTIHNTLKRMAITVKKTLYPDVKASQRVQWARVEFWHRVRSFLAQDLLFIDESGVNLALMRVRARSTKGSRAHGSRPNHRDKNVSIIGALSLNGVVTSDNVMGATNGLSFEAFISQKLVPKPWQGACVVMDNCSIHLGNTVRGLIEGAGSKLLYLPPLLARVFPD